MNKATLAALALVAAAMYYAWPSPSDGATAGDEESNAFLDTVDTMTSTIINGGWPPGSEPYRYAIEQAAATYNVPELILAWLLWKESRYNDAIVYGTKRSRVGAMGIAQFMPATAVQELGSEDAALNPQQAIPGAARYLARLCSQTGSWESALAAYNWGVGNVQRRGLSAAPAETVDYYTTILTRSGYAEATA